MLKTILLPTLLLITTSSLAQEILTLDQALQTGLQNNYSVRIAKNDASIAANNVTIGNAGFLPVVDVFGNITQGIDDSKQQYLSGQEVEKTGAKNTAGAAGSAKQVIYDLVPGEPGEIAGNGIEFFGLFGIGLKE